MADSHDMRYGRTFWELYPATRGETLNESCWSSWQYLDEIQWLDLTESGNEREQLSTADLVLRGEFLTLDIGESPNVVVESSLSSILQEDAPLKYSLSAQAARGALTRCKRKGSQIPPEVERELVKIAGGPPTD